jgi:hypothetical protein
MTAYGVPCRPVFLPCSRRPAISGLCPNRRPATPDEIAKTLSSALRYDGRHRVRMADDAMAGITAERLVERLQRSGFVLMKRPPARAPG